MRHLIIILSLVLLVSLSGCSYCNWLTCDYAGIQDAVDQAVEQLRQERQPAHVPAHRPAKHDAGKHGRTSPISPIATPTATCGEGDYTVCIR